MKNIKFASAFLCSQLLLLFVLVCSALSAQAQTGPLETIANNAYRMIDDEVSNCRSGNRNFNSATIKNSVNSQFRELEQNGTIEPEHRDHYIGGVNRVADFQMSKSTRDHSCGNNARVDQFKNDLGNVFRSDVPQYCRTQGAACDANSTCCGNLVCFTPVIPPPVPIPNCKDEKVTCSADNDCCTGFCHRKSKTCEKKYSCVTPVAIDQNCNPLTDKCVEGTVCKKFYTTESANLGGLKWFFAYAGPARLSSGKMVVGKEENGCKTNGIGCTENGECCSRNCHQNYKRCEAVTTDPNGVSCSPLKQACTRDDQCCSRFCSEARTCDVLFKCLNCANRGASPTAGQRCCYGLYLNENNLCIPDSAPPIPLGHLQGSSWKKWAHILWSQLTISSAVADDQPGKASAETISDEKLLEERIRKNCNFSYLIIKTQPEVFLNSFEFLAAGGNIDDHFEGTDPATNWEFNNKSKVLALKYRNIRRDISRQANHAITTLTADCAEAYRNEKKGVDAAGVKFRALLIKQIKFIKELLTSSYVAYQAELLPGFNEIYTKMRSTQWDALNWQVTQSETPERCRDWLTILFEDYILPVFFWTPLGMAIISAIGMDPFSLTNIVSMFQQFPRRDCQKIERGWFIDLGAFDIQIGICRKFKCTNTAVVENTACNMVIPNSSCIKTLYKMKFNQSDVYLIDPMLPEGAVKSASNPGGFIPLRQEGVSMSYAELTALFTRPYVIFGATSPLFNPALNMAPVDLDRVNLAPSFEEKFNTLAKKYAVEQGLYKIQGDVGAGGESNLDNFASYTYNQHFIFRNQSSEAKYPATNLTDYYKIAVELLMNLDTEGRTGILSALNYRLQQMEDNQRDTNVLLEQTKKIEERKIGGVAEGAAGTEIVRSAARSRSNGNLFNFNFSAITVKNEGVLSDDSTLLGSNRQNIGPSGVDGEKLSKINEKAAAIKRERQQEFDIWKQRVGSTPEGKAELEYQKALTNTMGGFAHFGPNLGNSSGGSKNAKGSANVLDNGDFSLFDENNKKNQKSLGGDAEGSAGGDATGAAGAASGADKDKAAGALGANAESADEAGSPFAGMDLSLKGAISGAGAGASGASFKSGTGAGRSLVQDLNEQEKSNILRALENDPSMKGGAGRKSEKGGDQESIFKKVSQAYMKRAFPVLLKPKNPAQTNTNTNTPGK